MNRLQTTGLAVASTLAAIGTVGSTSALAATNWGQWGSPGGVVENYWHDSANFLPAVVECQDQTGVRGVKMAGPTVNAVALSNGSRWQYILYRAVEIDPRTNHVLTQPQSPWVPVSTSNPVKLPDLYTTVAYGQAVLVKVVVWWWDPVSQNYSGEKWYTVNSYLTQNYFGVTPGSNYC